MGCPPEGVVVRSIDVTAVHREGQARNEIICFAMTRHTIMRYVELLKRCKLNTVGVHTEAMAMVRSFDHLNRRDSDVDVTTLYVDMGWGGTCVAIAHGKQMVFARYIQIGGRHLDQLIAKALHCDTTDARAHRLSMEGPVAHSVRSASSSAGQGNALLNAATAAAGASEDSGKSPPTTAVTQADRRVGAVPAEFCREVQAVSYTHLTLPTN